MNRLLVYAVNTVGLGHAVRLSILQKQLQRQHQADCHFFTDSDHVRGLFTCPGIEARVPPGADGPQRAKWINRSFQHALRRVQPDVLVCDTYWPPNLTGRRLDTGPRTVLLLRLMNHMLMPRRVRSARELFDTVLIPHHPSEISWTFRRTPEAVRRLSAEAVGFVGPIARRAHSKAAGGSVIFTVGGGGEWPGAGHANRIPTYLKVFFEAAGQLIRRGHHKPVLAVGPLMRLDPRFSERFALLRTANLHTHFGEGTVVVSRGGYNTCWEAVGASSRLVLCGSHRSEEDIDARCRFLDHERLGRRVTLSARALVDAIERPWSERERQATRRWAPLVNAGIPVALGEIMGARYLRARES
ncbi:MAG: hypothetical protein K2Y23_27120 [Cyanobacteria bacterium]|nr:hypothetical protein [Cyanobacteriota bacterium]